jgi:predicted DNA-binding transcriptional regulator AlpA
MRKSDRRALEDFDQLPASAHVRMPVVAALFAISPATVWRWCKSGHLPRPAHIQGVTYWEVGDLRMCLQATQGRELHTNRIDPTDTSKDGSRDEPQHAPEAPDGPHDDRSAG